MDAILEIAGFRHRYPGGGEVAAPDLDLEAGEAATLIGPSGSGKSTLLAAVAGLLRPTAGSIRLLGECWDEIPSAGRDRRRGRILGFVPQDAHLVPTLTVVENLRLAQYLAGEPQVPERRRQALGALGLEGLADRRPATLSRGEKQRAAIARAVVNRPRLLLADEPTAALDDAAAAAVLELLAGAAAELGAALLVASHDSRLKGRMGRMLEMRS